MKARNKIACSAERLGLLDPQMIQSVADANAFQIGRQYVTENRVRIVDADDAQISSAVIGNSGLYEQTIRLKDGHLISKCSCTLPEEPMCRHCIAVLLEYHRWAQPRQPQTQKAKAAKPAQPSSKPEPSTDGKPTTTQSSAPDVKLSEIMLFVEWLDPAMTAIEHGTAIPDPPPLESGTVSTWITNIRNLEDQRREFEEDLASLESEMRDREAYLGRLTQQLQASITEAKAAQATSQELQREVLGYKEILANVAGMVADVVRQEGELRSAAAELLNKSTHLDKLTGSFKGLTESLTSAAKQVPLK